MATHVDGAKMPRTEKKKLIYSIKQKAKDVLSSRQNANNIVEILEYVQSDDEDVVNAALLATSKVFSTLLSQNELKSSSAKSGEPPLAAISKEEKYCLWLQARYSDAIRCVSRVVGMHVLSSAVQELALRTLMKFVAEESKHPLRDGGAPSHSFPLHVITHLVPRLLAKTVAMNEMIGRFKEFMEFDDVRYYVLQQIHQVSMQAKAKLSQSELSVMCSNTALLLDTAAMPTHESITNFLGVTPKPKEGAKVTLLKEHRRVFTAAWLAFLRLPLPTSVYKQILVDIHERVMPHMTSPLLLTDFLTTLYDTGGAISLLALNGIFVLINEYNLEYPEFYTKLYAMLEPSIFHVKYRARFFHLLDIFLSSSHLPSYVVAAFAKRLSRLGLTAPPHALLMLIPFVCNLLIRHPNCKVLIHRPDGPREISEDPYLAGEPSPARCQALDSSLWELQTLKSHYHPSVANSAASIEKPFPKVEWDVGDYLELTIPKIIAKETKKKMKTMPLEYEGPKGLLGGGQDTFDGRFWCV